MHSQNICMLMRCMVLSEGGFQERLWVLEGFVICWEVEMKPCLWQVEQCKVFCGGKVDFLLSITSFSSSSNPVGPVNVSICLSFPAVDTLISDPEHCSSDVLQWLVGSPLSLGQYIYKTPPCWSSPCSSSWNRSLLAPETFFSMDYSRVLFFLTQGPWIQWVHVT